MQASHDQYTGIADVKGMQADLGGDGVQGGGRGCKGRPTQTPPLRWTARGLRKSCVL